MVKDNKRTDVRYSPIRLERGDITLVSVSSFHNAHVLPQIEKLLNTYKDAAVDDYDARTDAELVHFVYDLADACYPYFVAGYYKNNFVGVSYCTNWQGNASQGRMHSCNIHAAAKREFWGVYTRPAFQLYLDYLFGIVYRIEAAVPTNNFITRASIEDVGFVFEGVCRSGSMKKGKFVDLSIYSKLRKEHLNQKETK